ncbi:hypothetical protein COT97_05670 [Candidatus Falkowbacteria bacterium CG10_big_fil_rev_8_21_14_0_10_39_11]|uniref:Uncharacterized protein n=1 Tax=Candidatus Falkowbacteria bacterium CG10_big_fil_rev_8_21_14_0_10_39_11 TaxID=1974565 RepID=A0A2H0V3I2_9BACT|nr:MAG: hypothetical protein COT97_05670 [Candidatus Falkowbacteria bacterium CG10_big_fil_rev_8_21_14_0_10_39_11]
MTEVPPQQPTLKDAYNALPPKIKSFIPEANFSYYEGTNRLHCGPQKTGGSKFVGLDNIFQVFNHIDIKKLIERIKEQNDDRDELKDAGTPESAFFPAKRLTEHPAGLPEALYFKIPDIKGTLSIQKLSDLPDDTRVLVAREKGHGNPEKKETYNPASFTAFIPDQDMPTSDFATVIVGREADSTDFSLWTLHPGPPIRPLLTDFNWTANLKSSEEISGTEKPTAIVTTVGELKKYLGHDDYIKISTGDLESELTKFDFTEK